MDSDRILTGTEKLLSILHRAILFLSALMFTFVFIINQEDWFFGTKLAGPLAGVFLAAKAAGAIILLFLVTRYPDRRKAVLPASIAYFGFLFVNATVTYQKTAESGSFPVLLAILVVIPVLLLVLALVSGTPGAGRDADNEDTYRKREVIPRDDGKRSCIHPLLLLLGGIVLLMVCYIFLLPLVIAIVITHVPFLHQMVLPPSHDTLLVKVDSAGNREWTTVIPGYSLDFVQLVDGDNRSCIVFGTYWMPQLDEAQIRVMKLDSSGNRVWDMTRSRQFGPGPEGTAQIVWVEPEGAGTAVWLTNGVSLQVDGQGAVIIETAASDTLSQPSSGVRMPARYYTSGLPATTASIRIREEERQGLLFSVEDPVFHHVLQSIYSVNPTADGGYLVSASI